MSTRAERMKAFLKNRINVRPPHRDAEQHAQKLKEYFLEREEMDTRKRRRDGDDEDDDDYEPYSDKEDQELFPSIAGKKLQDQRKQKRVEEKQSRKRGGREKKKVDDGESIVSATALAGGGSATPSVSAAELAGRGSAAELAGGGSTTELAGGGSTTELAGGGSTTELAGGGSATSSISATELAGGGSATSSISASGPAVHPIVIVPTRNIDSTQSLTGEHPKQDKLSTKGRYKIIAVAKACFFNFKENRAYDDIAIKSKKTAKIRGSAIFDLQDGLKLAENCTGPMKEVNELSEQLERLLMTQSNTDCCYLDFSNPSSSVFLLKNGRIYDMMTYIDDDLIERCSGKNIKQISSEVARSTFKDSVYNAEEMLVGMSATINGSRKYVDIGKNPLKIMAEFVVSITRECTCLDPFGLSRTTIRQVISDMLSTARKELRKLEGGEKKIKESCDALKDFLAQNPGLEEKVEQYSAEDFADVE